MLTLNTLRFLIKHGIATIAVETCFHLQQTTLCTILWLVTEITVIKIQLIHV